MSPPLQKKPSLDRNIVKNYRPVSNLSFISKLIEKVVAKQLNKFISHEGLLNVNQSAYKSSHSTETALLKIQNDIALSVDSGKAVALTLLDLSAVFDTIDHSLLYDCLHDWFGLDGTVLSWIKSYLSNRKQKNKGLLNVNQSAYKSSHSTETALLEIQNDITLSVDSGKAVALTLLDLSVVFDTIDHSLLYDCLHDWFGLDGTVLSWIKSYLSNRKQKIKIGDSFSEAVILPFGVPQGSVLGPLLFTLYTSPLSQVISKFNVIHHLYADDTQIYLAVDSRNFDSSMEELTECLKSIQEWMDSVKLKLNPEKNEFIIIGQKAIRESLAPNFPVPLLQNNISPFPVSKKSGCYFRLRQLL